MQFRISAIEYISVVSSVDPSREIKAVKIKTTIRQKNLDM